jgi:signal transduction histidine kinase
MRPTPLVRRLVVPALLIALVGWLAALEYHWLDEVSQADRNRRRASLQQHATEFATAFDRELSRVYVMLSSASALTTPAAEAAFGHRYDAWREAAADPQMVRALYRASAAPTGAVIAEFNPGTHAFTKTEWPEALAPLRAQLDRSATHTSGTVGAAIELASSVGFRDTVNADIPAIIASPAVAPPPMPPGMNAFVSLAASPDLLIAYLDRAYIQTTMLPALAARYFPATGEDPYRLAVIDPRHGDTPVMTSNWPNAVPIDTAHSDASEPFFQLRSDVTAEILQRGVLTATPNIIVRRADGGSASSSETDGGLRPQAAAGAGGRTAESSTFQIAVQGRTDDSKGSGARGGISTFASALRLTTRPTGGWRLVLQHSSGSLDAAVNRARVRNLWLSFGLLAVLAAGVVLIVTNAQRSERLATQQMDFVATVSHELRTPLAVIRSAAQNLSAGVIEDPERARQYGALIDAEGRRLTEMVEQVLDYAGIAGAARPDLARPVDLGPIVADVAEACAPLATAAGVRIETDIAPGLPVVSGDAQALRSAVQNLVTNALKYGADGGWVGVDVRPGHSGSKPCVVVTVRDRGLGVDPQDRKHVFEPFYRGRRAIDAQVRGNGLGLSLVKRIAEAHGGRVGLETEPGAGAAFTVSLPAAIAAAHEPSLVDARAAAE